VRRTKDGLVFKFGYAKTGGQPKDSYQAYVLAFTDKNSEKISKLTPQQAIEDGLATIAHTQLASFSVDAKAPRAVQQTDELGEYQITFKLDTEKFVKKMLDAKHLGSSTNTGGWQQFDDKIRLAVFIPFLDDEKYSIHEELPNDKHECNYRGGSALLFQPITQRLTVAFGVVRAFRLQDGKHFTELDGTRGRKADAR